MRFILLISSLFILGSTHHTFACPFDGNENNAGTLSPTVGYQTVSVANGDYFIVNVNCGDTYNFNFCNNGGTAGWDTQITILNTDGSTEYAYNDDNCGLQSDVSWQATFTGTVYVLITEYFCNLDGTYTGATMAYNVTSGSLSGNASFTLSANNCNSASATITGDTGGIFTFNPAPGDGATINSSTGAISNGTAGTTYTVEYSVNCVSTTESVPLPNSGNASFSLSVICGGATATITGDLGGTFAFNPVPGDGAQINTSTGNVTNGTAGTTYSVEYTVCGTTNTENVTVLDDNCFTLNGDAQYITVGAEDCIQLTDEVNNQTGCAWNGSQIDFNSNFTLTLDYYFGNNIGGADGNTFSFQPSASTACGQDGGQLGAGGLSNALSIEFDTYDNDYPTHLYDMGCDHIAVEIDGNHMGPGAPYAGPVCAKSGGGNIDDGGTYTVDIEWDATAQQLDIYFDGALRLSTTGDFVNTVFGGQNLVYWGATSATGGLNNQQYFCPSTVQVLPVELSQLSYDCESNSGMLSWSTLTEYRFDHFEVEYTTDGQIFLTEGLVDAMGNTEETQHYSFDVSEHSGDRYYRLKMVDEDGAFEYSPIIMAGQCLKNDLIHSTIEKENSLSVKLGEKASIRLLNSFGQLVYENAAYSSVFDINTTGISTGVYILKVYTKDGLSDQRKLLLK
jgi:hypothetical protein